MLIIILPLLLVLALSIRVTMGSPTLFRQVRVGRNGKRFEILKFRTLPAGGEEPNGRVTWEALRCEDDRECTRLGAFLRRTSLDELPQLVNVLRGDMSLVGPRPERPELVELFSRDIPGYSWRHRVRGGITGWAQVHGVGRGGERFSRSALARRAALDNAYIDRWSLALDARIVLRTWRAVVRFRQADVQVASRPAEPLPAVAPPLDPVSSPTRLEVAVARESERSA